VNVHLDATEYNDHIVFLHTIQEGPANRSYGLQVAKLAGIPAAVINAAKHKLTELESGATATAPLASADTPQQADLFVAVPHPLVERVRELDPDGLNARQALELLYELKGLVD
jgi:DNA mismatch repair protein MutS